MSPVNEEKELTAELDYYRAINRMLTTELEEQQGEDLEFPEVPTTLPVHIQNDLQRHKSMIKNILNKQITITEVVEEPMYDGDSITTSFTNIDFKTDKRKETEVQNQPTQTDINHSELENILEENKALMHVTGNQKKILEEKEQIVLELENKLKLVTVEKEKALLRISKLAGARLTEDNPGISDLSDTYRPLKIAEMFSELYDNEWTDALSIQISEMQKSEEDAIQNLLEILQQISILCCIGVSEQRTHLYDAMIFRNDNKNPELTVQNTPKLLLQKVKKFQKKTATAFFPEIEQSILDNDTFRGQLRKEAELCQAYIRKCIQLCWMMYVQEPAMELVFEFYAGQDSR
ncbi:hypothetical protein KUTeg_024202 [Tegillarca granosa]|uniref:Mitochondria-eating protein C-terminal domain-containing protein n=1 Tax=Tegillarca granosa TaxID=220873 RepID=A0ABQ9E1S8_TEGGR|nr:hypothetical protein KUTeg_024202 [Tegillarca granosa]